MGGSAAVSAWAAPPKTQWLIIAHLDARGGLTQAAASYERQLRAASTSLGLTIALQTVADGPPPTRTLRRELLGPGRTPTVVQVAPAESPATTLAALVSWASELQPAERYALLVMGHGAGLVGGGAALPADAMRPAMIRQGLQQARERLGQPLDVLCLDTCYGAALEVLYGLRGLCRYVTAAPGLINSPGLNWEGALSDLACDPVPLTLVRGLVSRGMLQREASLALVGVDMDRLGLVSERMHQLADELQLHLPDEMQTLTWARAHSRSWGDHAELVDVAGLADGLHENAATPAVRQAAGELFEGLASLVTAIWKSEGGSKQGAVGVFFPPTLSETPPEYRTSYQFAQACGWAPLLESYWARLTQLLNVSTP